MTDFDLSLSLKIKSNCAIGIPIFIIYNFQLVSDTNYMSVSHRLAVYTCDRHVRKFFPSSYHWAQILALNIHTNKTISQLRPAYNCPMGSLNCDVPLYHVRDVV